MTEDMIRSEFAVKDKTARTKLSYSMILKDLKIDKINLVKQKISLDEVSEQGRDDTLLYLLKNEGRI